MNKIIRTYDELPVLFDRPLLMRLLGVSEQTIRNYEKMKDNPLPSYDLCGTKRYRKDEIVEWIEKHKERQSSG